MYKKDLQEPKPRVFQDFKNKFERQFLCDWPADVIRQSVTRVTFVFWRQKFGVVGKVGHEKDDRNGKNKRYHPGNNEHLWSD
jgi:hypothetical protein